MTQAPLVFDRSPIPARFEEFHSANPHVYEELVRLARQAKRSGRQRIGIRMLWERMRWTFSVEVVRPEGAPRLNDHFTSRYARLIQQQEQDLRDFFETRGLRS